MSNKKQTSSRVRTWLTSPASMRFYLRSEHNLLIHSAGVRYNALKIKNLMAPDIMDGSIMVAAMFHDVGNRSLTGKPYYLPNDNRWEIEKRGTAYKANLELVTMNLAVRSFQHVSRFITLTGEEAQVIVAHDGLYPVNGGVANLEYCHRECRLTTILHFADLWTAVLGEEGKD